MYSVKKASLHRCNNLMLRIFMFLIYLGFGTNFAKSMIVCFEDFQENDKLVLTRVLSNPCNKLASRSNDGVHDLLKTQNVLDHKELKDAYNKIFIDGLGAKENQQVGRSRIVVGSRFENMGKYKKLSISGNISMIDIGGISEVLSRLEEIIVGGPHVWIRDKVGCGDNLKRITIDGDVKKFELDSIIYKNVKIYVGGHLDDPSFDSNSWPNVTVSNNDIIGFQDLVGKQRKEEKEVSCTDAFHNSLKIYYDVIIGSLSTSKYWGKIKKQLEKENGAEFTTIEEEVENVDREVITSYDNARKKWMCEYCECIGLTRDLLDSEINELLSKKRLLFACYEENDGSVDESWACREECHK